MSQESSTTARRRRVIPRYRNQGNTVVKAPEPRQDSVWGHSGNGSTTKSTKATKQASSPARSQAVPASRVAWRRIAGKLSGRQRDSMRAGRPRSRVGPPPHHQPNFFLIHIDAQDFFRIRLASVPGHPQSRIGSSPNSASCAGTSRPAYPVYPVHPCSIFGCHTPNLHPHQSVDWCSFVSIGGSPFSFVDIFPAFVTLLPRYGSPQRLRDPVRKPPANQPNRQKSALPERENQRGIILHCVVA